MGETVTPDPAIVSARVAAFRHFCDATGETLDEFIAEMQLQRKSEIVVAASHLKDSLAVFTRVCERRLLQGDDL